MHTLWICEIFQKLETQQASLATMKTLDDRSKKKHLLIIWWAVKSRNGWRRMMVAQRKYTKQDHWCGVQRLPIFSTNFTKFTCILLLTDQERWHEDYPPTTLNQLAWSSILGYLSNYTIWSQSIPHSYLTISDCLHFSNSVDFLSFFHYMKHCFSKLTELQPAFLVT